MKGPSRPSPYTALKALGGLAASAIYGKSTAKGRQVAKKSLGYQASRANRRPKMELKCIDTPYSGQFFTLAGTFSLLNPIVVGSEIYQRNGRKVYMKSVHIRGVVTNAVTSQQDVARIMVVYDSQPSGATPTLAQLLSDSTAAQATSGLSHINLANRERFKILRDHQIMLPSVTNTAGVLTNGPVVLDPIRNTLNYETFIPLKGLETVYNNVNGGTIADIASGALFVLLVSSTYNNQWSYGFSARLRYYD